MKLPNMKIMILLLKGFLNKTHNCFNCLILFKDSSMKFNTNISTTLIFLETLLLTLLGVYPDETPHTIARTQTPVEPIFTQLLPFLIPPFYAHCQAFENFLLPSKTFLTIPFSSKRKKMPLFSPLFKHG